MGSFYVERGWEKERNQGVFSAIDFYDFFQWSFCMGLSVCFELSTNGGDKDERYNGEEDQMGAIPRVFWWVSWCVGSFFLGFLCMSFDMRKGVDWREKKLGEEKRKRKEEVGRRERRWKLCLILYILFFFYLVHNYNKLDEKKTTITN